MDFTSRHSQPERAAAAAAAPAAPATAARASEKKSNNSSIGKQPVWLRAGYMILLVLVALLVAAVLVLLYTERPKPESSFVDTSKLQAVFLNTNPNQVYFGKLVSVNSQYLVLTDIYYLQTSSSSGSTTSTSNSSVSLIKLGCELHQPYDQMVLNRDQVSFWENIKDDGQVAKAVAAFQKANPNGQKCTTQTDSTNQSTTNSVQNSGTSSSNSSTNSSTGTTGTGTTKQ